MQGRDMPSAVKRAKRYLWRVVERSVDLPLGKGTQVGGLGSMGMAGGVLVGRLLF